jgi:hypothetical protein
LLRTTMPVEMIAESSPISNPTSHWVTTLLDHRFCRRRQMPAEKPQP